ncbi:imelysin family protein [Luteibaculum oceani]|uniref:Imelysin-like domain-containing protein n=1 Tax=Luteibaculum oceani TaxID=1294296 RepID=A0A5C6UUB7_9FLAO|nr:imelysin family protein [Luteibaculum oceani]TXC76962.1 hypothetical protein FRX97_10130 [Luteibaculum oceani]
MRINKIISGLAVLLTGALLLSSCDEKNTPPVISDCVFDLQGMQASYRLEAASRSEAIQAAVGRIHTELVTKFAETPNQASLDRMREDFVNAYLLYQGFAGFDIGQGFDYREGTFFNEWANTFPTNTDSIETRISQGKLNLTNASRLLLGFPALEYMLYGIEPTDAEIINRYQNDGNAVMMGIRQAFYLEQLFRDINEFWTGDESEFFNLSSGSGDGSPLALMVNSLVKDFEFNKNFKLKSPAGRYNGGNPQPEQAEGKFMDKTISLAKANYQYNKTLLYGTNSNGESISNGILAYVECIDPTVSAAITDQFNFIDGLWMELQDPFSEIVNDSQKLEKLNILINELQKLTPALKAQMTSVLNVRITYQDNDGD